MSAIYDALVEILVGRFGVDSSLMAPDVTFADLELDSLFLVEFLMVAENTLGIGISDDAVLITDTVGQAAETLSALSHPAGNLS